MKPEDIVEGNSYACTYTDLTGRDCVAIIVMRDLDSQAFLLRDVETEMEFTARFDQVRDIDTVEWTA